MNMQLDERKKELRTKQNLLLWQFAPLLEMDTAQLSKNEKGLRQLKREQIPILSENLKVDNDELQTLWLVDQIYAVVKYEKFVNEVMKVAEKKINFKNTRSNNNEHLLNKRYFNNC